MATARRSWKCTLSPQRHQCPMADLCRWWCHLHRRIIYSRATRKCGRKIRWDARRTWRGCRFHGPDGNHQRSIWRWWRGFACHGQCGGNDERSLGERKRLQNNQKSDRELPLPENVAISKVDLNDEVISAVNKLVRACDFKLRAIQGVMARAAVPMLPSVDALYSNKIQVHLLMQRHKRKALATVLCEDKGLWQ